MISLSIIIPTIGRKSLLTSVASALDQLQVNTEVIVVDDSNQQNIELDVDGIKLIKTGGNRGVSYARNLGVFNSHCEWIAFLDDDDTFLPNKSKIQIDYMLKNNLDASYTAAYISGRRKVRPKKCIVRDLDPLIQIYSKMKILSSPFYLPTPSLVVSKKLASKIKFDETLKEREDLHYMHQIFKNGYSLEQVMIPLVEISKESKRSLMRPSIKQDLKWAKYLDEVEKHLGKKFLIYISLRNRIYTQDYNGVFKILSELSKNKFNYN